MGFPDSSAIIPNTVGVPLVTTSTQAQMIGAASTVSSSTSTVPSGTSIGNSMEALREKSPKVYDAMLLGIATSICNRMKDSQKRIQKMNREARNQGR